jgi:hypothetical protein
MNILGPEIGYIDLLDAHLSEPKIDKKKYNPLRPSSAGKCTKELGYQMQEFLGIASYEKEPISPDLNRLFSLGHSVEWSILKMFEELEIFEVKYRQQAVRGGKITEKKIMEGSIDACFISEKWKAVVDVKSKGNKFSGWSRSQWDEHSEKYSKMKSVLTLTDRVFWIDDLKAFLEEVNDPFLADNFYQLNWYANTQFIKESGIDHGAIIQYCKSDSRLRELRFRPSADLAEMVERKFRLVAGTIEGGGSVDSLPRDFVLGSIKCAFCPYKAACWPDSDAKDAYFKTWPKKRWPDRTSKLGDVGRSLEDLFSRYANVENSEKEKTRLEQLIALEMHENQIQKIELEDGRVYDLKMLKSGPVPRRGKK